MIINLLFFNRITVLLIAATQKSRHTRACGCGARYWRIVYLAQKERAKFVRNYLKKFS
jgi:hypothetical protein